MEGIKTIFGKNVRKYREKMNWSQAELAEKIDISTTFMSNIERGTRGVSMETIECLAVIFGIPYRLLFEDADSEPIPSDKIKMHQLKKQILTSVTETIDDFLEHGEEKSKSF